MPSRCTCPIRTIPSRASARTWGASRETLRNWVRAERERTGAPAAGRGATRPSRPSGEVSSKSVLEEENKQPRAQIRKLETEREILRRAAKYFAGETNW